MARCLATGGLTIGQPPKNGIFEPARIRPADWLILVPISHVSDGRPSHRGEVPVGTLLVVDDDPRLGRLYARWLGDAGHRVVLATSLAAGRELMDAGEPTFDVALVDLRLPDGSGDELIGPLLDRVPLCLSIVITGVADPAVQRRIARLGAHASLVKPISFPDLVDTVGATLRATRAWRALTEEDRHETAERVTFADMEPRRTAGVLDIDDAVAQITALGELNETRSEIARRMILGEADRDIASGMKMNLRTVKFHVSEVIKRTGAKNRRGLVGLLLARVPPRARTP